MYNNNKVSFLEIFWYIIDYKYVYNKLIELLCGYVLVLIMWL